MQKPASFLAKNGAGLTAGSALAISLVALWVSFVGKTIEVSGLLGTIPQWITVFVASGALSLAWVSIQSQREIARKRAATDFFLKTEMDSHLLDAYRKYLAGVESLETHVAAGKSLDEFTRTDGCRAVRDYLNVHELMAVGIHQEVFDDNVCFDFWHRELIRAYSKTDRLIAHIQSLPGNHRTYSDLIVLINRWEPRVAKGAA